MIGNISGVGVDSKSNKIYSHNITCYCRELGTSNDYIVKFTLYNHNSNVMNTIPIIRKFLQDINANVDHPLNIYGWCERNEGYRIESINYNGEYVHLDANNSKKYEIYTGYPYISDTVAEVVT